MSKFSDQLRTIDVINTYDLLRTFGEKGRDVACIYSPYQPRQMRGNCTHVYSPSHKTDPEAHWTDHGQKSFSGKPTVSMPEALAWASEKYGITEWAANPTDRGSKIPAYVLAKAKAAVKTIRTAVLSA